MKRRKEKRGEDLFFFWSSTHLLQALHEEDGEGTHTNHIQRSAKGIQAGVCSVSCTEHTHTAYLTVYEQHTQHFNPHLFLCSVFQKEFCCKISNSMQFTIRICLEFEIWICFSRNLY